MKRLLNFYLPTFLSICLLVTAGLFWYTQQVQAAIARVAQTGNNCNAATCAATISPSAGDFIVVALYFRSDTCTFTNVTDNATGGSDSYTTNYNLATGDGHRNLALAYAWNIKSGVTTVTANFSVGCFSSVIASEYSGMGASDPADAAVGAVKGTTGTAQTSNSITTVGLSDVVIGSCLNDTSSISFTPTSPWSVIVNQAIGGDGPGQWGAEDQVNAAAGSYNASFTTSGSISGYCAAAAFKAEASASTPCSGVTKTGLTVCGGTLLVKGGCLVVGGPGGCGGGGPTAISLVEVKGAKSADGVAASVVNFTTNTTAGELILVFKTDTNGAEFTPTDNKGDTYTKVFEVDNISTHADYALWYAANVPSGVNQVTASTANAPNGEGIIVAHYTGIAAAPLDVSTSTPIHCSTCQVGNPGGQSSPWASDNITTTQSNELLVGLDFCGDANCSPVAAQDSYWTTQKTQGCRNCNGQLLIYGDKIESSIVTKNSSGTGGGAGNNFPAIAIFKSQ